MTVIFTPSAALNTNDTNASTSFRNTVDLTSGSTGQVRATFAASSVTGLIALHCSIGVWVGSGSNSDTTATPIELLFGGVSGFTIAAGQTITSDFATLNFSNTDKLIVIIDTGTTGGNRFSSGNTNCLCYFNAGASYNLSTVPVTGGGSFSLLSGVDYMVSSVETGAGTVFLQSQICM